VELDAESQVEVAARMAAKGLSPVGWYHSHPIFEARPSLKDNENQRNYQALCRDPDSGLEPWVGAIVGPYDQALPSLAAVARMWVVRGGAGSAGGGGGGPAAYNMRAVLAPPVEMPGAEEEGLMAE
jgi:hypothetical protein